MAAAMAPWRRRAWLGTAVAFLLGGWLTPQYVSKLWGTTLQRFLQDLPLSAAFLSQSLWMLLLLPNPWSRRREEEVLPDAAARCGSCAGQATRAAWILALMMGLLVAAVHSTWYSSFSRTNVATNTLLWNTDTLTTPFIALLISRQRPATGAVIGGMVGLAGAGVAVGASVAGDTLLGCGLVLSASCGYAVNAVFVEKVRDPRHCSVLRLLGMEGAVAAGAVLLAGLGAAVWRPEAVAEWWLALPPVGCLVLMASCSLLLNVGWLWCSELVSASWTAMVAVSTIPLTVALDLLLVGTQPAPMTLLGSSLVLLGFFIASGGESGRAGEPEEDCCRRWHGWGQARAAPLLPPASPGTASTAASGEDGCSSCSGAETGSPAEAEEAPEVPAPRLQEEE